MDLNTLLDILKVVVGLVYLYLEYHARREMWIASVIMPAIGIWLYFNKGLYADCAINVYYLLIAAYGYLTWSGLVGKRKSASQLPIRHTPLKTALLLIPIWLAIWGGIAWILARFTNSDVVMLDSFTTSLSIIALWMLARKYMEQWWVWFVVDAVYVYLYYHKGIYFSGTLYAFYTVMAVVGFFKWQKLAALRKN